jgi:hypothetical protein
MELLVVLIFIAAFVALRYALRRRSLPPGPPPPIKGPEPPGPDRTGFIKKYQSNDPERLPAASGFLPKSPRTIRVPETGGEQVKGPTRPMEGRRTINREGVCFKTGVQVKGCSCELHKSIR